MMMGDGVTGYAAHDELVVEGSNVRLRNAYTQLNRRSLLSVTAREHHQRRVEFVRSGFLE
jgi:hypothetical protein